MKVEKTMLETGEQSKSIQEERRGVGRYIKRET